MTSTTTFRIRIDPSCSQHPLLPQHHRQNLPAWVGISMSPPKLFGYSAMKIQDAGNPRVATYAQVRTKATSILDIVEHAVAFRPTGVDVSGDSETKTEVSELIGIGLGLAAACKVFRVNPNRVSRFTSASAGKRMDYEIVVGGRRYLHEVRGTTLAASHAKMVRNIAPKKVSTASQGYSGHSGAVVIYSQGAGKDYVDLVDPPTSGAKVPDLEELAVVLEYYHNAYRLTHTAPGWLSEIEAWLRRYRNGEQLPSPPSPGETLFAPRVTATHDVFGPLGGTEFDLRLLDRSIRRYRSFAAASDAIQQPRWLVATTPQLDRIVRSGDWSQLLQFETSELEPPNYAGGCQLPSGIAVVPLSSDPKSEEDRRAEFTMRRRRFLRSGRG